MLALGMGLALFRILGEALRITLKWVPVQGKTWVGVGWACVGLGIGLGYVALSGWALRCTRICAWWFGDESE